MSLTTGALLGTYEMQTRLGQGGMGEVYRARDARLARDVAIKILPDAFAGKPIASRASCAAVRTPVDRSRIGVLDREKHEVRWIVDVRFFGRYVPSGHLVYAQEHRRWTTSRPLSPFRGRAATCEWCRSVVVRRRGSSRQKSPSTIRDGPATDAICSTSSLGAPGECAVNPAYRVEARATGVSPTQPASTIRVLFSLTQARNMNSLSNRSV